MTSNETGKRVPQLELRLSTPSNFGLKRSSSFTGRENGGSLTASTGQSVLNAHFDSVAGVMEHRKGDRVRWSSRIRDDEQCGLESDHLTATVTDNSRCVTRGLSVVINTLRILCMYPRCASESGKHIGRRWRTFLLLDLAVLAILLNVYLCKHTVGMILLFMDKFGFLHASTVSSIITGIKPLINLCVVSLFVIRMREHQRVLDLMDSTEERFRASFSRSPPFKCYSITFALIVILSLAAPFTLRVVEFYCTSERIFTHWMTDLSFILVPLLTAWNIVPLVHYEICNRTVRSWCRLLAKNLRKERDQRQRPLRFYYELFLRVTSVQEAIGEFFNPFIMFSLAWPLVILSLTIYFITEPSSSLVEPLSAFQFRSEAIREHLTRKVRFTLAWASMQVIVAVIYIFTICSTGMRTNEDTRRIIGAVLTITPGDHADHDRFEVSCFVHKMATQYMWGMTVWRAFPLERTTFFTLVSVIITYSFLLLKLRDNPAVSPIRRILLTNSTST